jgi:transaldolase
VVKVFLDSADLSEMIRLNDKVSGFTTNPTLMRKAGVTDYKSFAKIVADRFPDKPVSLEVIADDFKEMERQARLLASLGPNIYVKIPITNTKGESSVPLIRDLVDLHLNITAVMAFGQWGVFDNILDERHIVSFFCGRQMDTLKYPFGFTPKKVRYQRLWASAREIFHLRMAEDYGYDIITLTPDLIAKLDLKGKDLTQYSLETVQMFYNDAQKAGFVL